MSLAASKTAQRSIKKRSQDRAPAGLRASVTDNEGLSVEWPPQSLADEDQRCSVKGTLDTCLKTVLSENLE